MLNYTDTTNSNAFNFNKIENTGVNTNIFTPLGLGFYANFSMA
jgi:hypothetical protein